jgi:aldehyde dehydrogenase (NAD+)/betaine-aldehyde dehydrogenase
LGRLARPGRGCAIANDSPYGLSGGVWSADPARALGVARRLRTGSVAVNGS